MIKESVQVKEIHKKLAESNSIDNVNVKSDSELIKLGIRHPRIHINRETFRKTAAEKLALKEAKKLHKKSK
jgi:hypothetical protein